MRKNNALFDSPYWHWLWSERYQISVTVFAALLPVIANLISGMSNEGNVVPLTSDNLFDKYNDLFQAIFIFVTLFVLIHNMRKTKECLTNNKELIANYIERNTNRHIRHCKEKYIAFDIVSVISRQFYRMWIVVWALWLIYYVGKTMWNLGCNNNETATWIFEQVFDFLSTAAMYGIYLILNTATTKFELRSQKNYGIWNGVILLLLLFAIWISLITIAGTSSCQQAHQYSELFISVFSTISFVLVLGKLNSNYLQIPPLFLFIMYLYAIVQAYVPFKSVDIIHVENKDLVFSCKVIEVILPYATLIGKLFVMLTLCWIVDKKRLIFFIIHKSAALEETPVLLDELDSEPVEF